MIKFRVRSKIDSFYGTKPIFKKGKYYEAYVSPYYPRQGIDINPGNNKSFRFFTLKEYLECFDFVLNSLKIEED